MKKFLLLILSLFMTVMLTACSGNSVEPSIGGNTQTSSSSSGQTNRPDSSTNKSESNTGSVQSGSSNNSTTNTSTEPTSSPNSSTNKSESNTGSVQSSSSNNSTTDTSTEPTSSLNSSEPVSSDSTSSEQTSDNSTSETPSNTSSGERPAEPQPADTGKKVLVAYFSATGTTKALAEYAADAVNGDLYEIVPQEPYTSADLDYSDRNSRSSKEMDDASCRPAINGSVSDMSQYDIVFIGYPIWWGEAPRIVSTFMESYDFSGKTIVPFCTSASSGMGSSARNLHSLADNSVNWLDGARLSGSSSRGDMVSWINGLGLDINAE